MKFIILGNLTQKGIKSIKDAAKRHKQADEIAESYGCKIHSLYYTMGRYDWVAVVEGPDIESAMKSLFMFGRGGTNRTESLVAIPSEDVLKWIAELP